jgi:double-stranded uracil-DNA glycosylase
MVLPDLLDINLKVVFCGTAVSKPSASKNVYYANAGNKFYSTLYTCGFTSFQLKPEQYQGLLDFKIGLSDLAKKYFGGDKYLTTKDFDVIGFKNKMDQYKPEVICFNGKRAGKEFLFLNRKDHLPYGLLGQDYNGIKLFVAPSTAYKADEYWDIEYWHILFSLIQ